MHVQMLPVEFDISTIKTALAVHAEFKAGVNVNLNEI